VLSANGRYADDGPKQAEKAERMALAVSDAEISQSFMNMKAYRSQADMLKTKKPMAKKKSGKKRR
jgi:hypothetical protein